MITNNGVYADNTTIIVVSSVIGAVVLIALICVFQFVRWEKNFYAGLCTSV